jgi:hypothetical protein
MLAGYGDFDSCAEGVERRKYLTPCHLEKFMSIKSREVTKL